MNKWIKVTDELPEIEFENLKRGKITYSKSKRVLCFCKQESGKTMIKEGYCEISDGLNCGKPFWKIPGSIDYVTHWQPLPLPPDEYDYGIITYKPRFTVCNSSKDFKETTLNKCIRVSIEHKYKTMAKDKLITEIQIVYKDEEDNLHCLCEDLEKVIFNIKHKGDMMLHL